MCRCVPLYSGPPRAQWGESPGSPPAAPATAGGQLSPVGMLGEMERVPQGPPRQGLCRVHPQRPQGRLPGGFRLHLLPPSRSPEHAVGQTPSGGDRGVCAGRASSWLDTWSILTRVYPGSPRESHGSDPKRSLPGGSGALLLISPSQKGVT